LDGIGKGFVRSHASLGGTKSLYEAQGQVGNSDGWHSAAAVQRLKQGKARADAMLGQAKPAGTAGAGAGDVVHASVTAVGRALPSLYLADAVLRVGTGAVAKVVAAAVARCGVVPMR
jgi:hypothetical protein